MRDREFLSWLEWLFWGVVNSQKTDLLQETLYEICILIWMVNREIGSLQLSQGFTQNSSSKHLILNGGPILEVKNSLMQGYLISNLWLQVCVLTKMAMNADEYIFRWCHYAMSKGWTLFWV